MSLQNTISTYLNLKGYCIIASLVSRPADLLISIPWTARQPISGPVRRSACRGQHVSQSVGQSGVQPVVGGRSAVGSSAAAPDGRKGRPRRQSIRAPAGAPSHGTKERRCGGFRRPSGGPGQGREDVRDVQRSRMVARGPKVGIWGPGWSKSRGSREHEQCPVVCRGDLSRDEDWI